MITRKDLSQRQVRELLEYDPCTGVFTWLRRAGADQGTICFNSQFVGRVAGCLDRREKVGYRRIKIFSRYYAEHRLAWVWMTGEWPPHEVDHINGVRHDNRFANLRLATKSQNQSNARIRTKNKVGLKGVSYKPRIGKYHAQINKYGRVRHLGFFDDPQEAHEAYVKAAKELHGEFARAA